MRNKQKGTALVLAILIMTLCAIAGTALIKENLLTIRILQNVKAGDQASLYVQAGEAYVAQLLVRDKEKNKTDSLQDDWGKLIAPFDIDAGKIDIRVEDLQGRFNLNNLVSGEGKASKEDIIRFRRLLAALELDEELAEPVVDWIDSDINSTLPTGAEDDDYTLLPVPYRAANAEFVSTSELLNVKGFNSAIYEKLAPHIAALPGHVTVNVNTATAPVYAAVVEGLSLSEANQLVEQRGETVFADVAQFRGEQALNGRKVEDIGVDSNFFRVEITVQLDRYLARSQSVFKRAGAEGGLLTVIRHSRAEL